MERSEFGRVRREPTRRRLTKVDRTCRCLSTTKGMRGNRRTRRAVLTTCKGGEGVHAATLAEAPTVSEEALGNPKSVSAVILGGGAGTRLYPLTKSRAKPAVPIGGAYRLIDVPMSNCINSGIKKIYILTQFNSTSLNRHLAKTYNFGSGIRFGGAGFVEVLAATQTPESTPGGKDWFRGTADAVRQYSWLFTDIKNKDIEDVLILSGDHLYRMDYMDFVRKHRESGAGITVGCLPIDHSRASDFGLMKIDDTGRIIEFAEKPKGDALEAMKVDTSILGLSREEANLSPFIASMGIYVFKKSVLLDLLMKEFPLALDFGSEILPAASKTCKVQAYLFNDYWEDIGTIKSFFDANLALTQQPPRFEFYDPDNPIYTSPRFLPPAQIKKSHVVDSIISHGCFLQECSVEHSIIGLRSRVEKGADIKDTMLIGADYYESKEQRIRLLEAGQVPIGVGQNCVLRNCIADKNARIGKDCVIVNKDGVEEANREDEGLYIRSGIVTVLRNATVLPGTVI
uniref:Glucose-1-phosphate adenylyltransferase n=1 Tax=Picocystis salinarum TaxID=88271 RepID=A0A7S3XE97_9CHLO